jgi:hypothetical protein
MSGTPNDHGGGDKSVASRVDWLVVAIVTAVALSEQLVRMLVESGPAQYGAAVAVRIVTFVCLIIAVVLLMCRRAIIPKPDTRMTWKRSLMEMLLAVSTICIALAMMRSESLAVFVVGLLLLCGSSGALVGRVVWGTRAGARRVLRWCNSHDNAALWANRGLDFVGSRC